MNVVCNESNIVCNSESSSFMNGKSKRKRCDSETSAKLWHCRLGHILRGRIERLIKENILHLLDFSDVEYCINCIEGKNIKQIKKGAKCSAGVLEIIHRYLWTIPRKVCGRI